MFAESTLSLTADEGCLPQLVLHKSSDLNSYIQFSKSQPTIRELTFLCCTTNVRQLPVTCMHSDLCEEELNLTV